MTNASTSALPTIIGVLLAACRVVAVSDHEADVTADKKPPSSQDAGPPLDQNKCGGGSEPLTSTFDLMCPYGTLAKPEGDWNKSCVADGEFTPPRWWNIRCDVDCLVETGKLIDKNHPEYMKHLPECKGWPEEFSPPFGYIGGCPEDAPGGHAVVRAAGDTFLAQFATRNECERALAAFDCGDKAQKCLDVYSKDKPVTKVEIEGDGNETCCVVPPM